jgi:hypothetical protein
MRFENLVVSQKVRSFAMNSRTGGEDSFHALFAFSLVVTLASLFGRCYLERLRMVVNEREHEQLITRILTWLLANDGE